MKVKAKIISVLTAMSIFGTIFGGPLTVFAENIELEPEDSPGQIAVTATVESTYKIYLPALIELSMVPKTDIDIGGNETFAGYLLMGSGNNPVWVNKGNELYQCSCGIEGNIALNKVVYINAATGTNTDPTDNPTIYTCEDLLVNNDTGSTISVDVEIGTSAFWVGDKYALMGNIVLYDSNEPTNSRVYSQYGGANMFGPYAPECTSEFTEQGDLADIGQPGWFLNVGVPTDVAFLGTINPTDNQKLYHEDAWHETWEELNTLSENEVPFVITVNGVFDDTKPIGDDGRYLCPIEDLSELMPAGEYSGVFEVEFGIKDNPHWIEDHPTNP